jgi:transposase
MDNLSVHKSTRVSDLVEQRGCELWFLPAYSPDLNPIYKRPSPEKRLSPKPRGH